MSAATLHTLTAINPFGAPELIEADQQPQGSFACHDVVADAITRTASALGVEVGRVAAATWHLSAVAKALTSTYGWWLVGGTIPGLDGLRYNGSAITIARASVTDAQPSTAMGAARAAARCTDQLNEAMAGALAGLGQRHLNPAIVAGNTASALYSTRRVLRGQAPTARVGEVAEFADALGVEGVSQPTGPARDPYLTWRRESCCLFYQTPRGGYCGDCPLAHSHRAG